ncbi:MAG: DUF5686 and carboxypeptidase regulatory-like domain-containing protein [Bacteroidota bacterium]
MRIVYIVYLLLISLSLSAQSITGKVQAENGDALPYASVYILNSSIGTYADENGEFEIEGEGRQYILEVSLIGYETQKIGVDTRRDDFITITLIEQEIELQEAVVQGKKENVGKSIMKRVIANKEKVLVKDLSYSADSYFRTSMEKWMEATDTTKKKKLDVTFSVAGDDGEAEEEEKISENIRLVAGFEPVYLNENFARQHYKGSKSKREIKAELQQTGDETLKRRTLMTNDFNFDGSNRGVTYNPLEYFRNPIDANIDLYENQLRNPSISDLPITSPLSDNAFLTYQFKLIDIQKMEDDSILVIQVRPFFKEAPAFSGQLKIRQRGYLLQSADLKINSSALTLANSFELNITYDTIGGRYWRPTQRDIQYESKRGGSRYKVQTIVRESNFDLNPNFDKNFFNNEVIVYDLSALERDTAIWEDLRPPSIPLTQNQRTFVSEQDSIWRYRQSAEYYRIQDSIYNRNTLLDLAFNGIGWKRRAKGWTLYFNSLLESIRPFGVGGYRQALGGSVEKKFLATSNTLDINYGVNYGFRNEDWKGSLNVGYTYLPRKFARAFFEVQDDYEFITINTSVQSLLSRNNFVRNIGFGGGHAFEAWNGVYLTTAFEYADKQPINDLELAEWSNELFGADNTPINFERYQALFLRLEVMLKFDQQYITRAREKIVLGTRYPTVNFKYRKGVPGVWESEVAFDQLELEIFHRPTSKLGSSNWNVQAGTFLNQKNLRTLEHRFFRGGTPFFFIDPLRSQQLLDGNLSTPNLYVQGGLMHHFDGFILDKIPLLNQLQLEMLVGGSFLTIPNQSFAHVEAFIGVGKKFRLFKELVQVAVYAVSGDNQFEDAAYTYRVGFNFFNAFSGEWLY